MEKVVFYSHTLTHTHTEEVSMWWCGHVCVFVTSVCVCVCLSVLWEKSIYVEGGAGNGKFWGLNVKDMSAFRRMNTTLPTPHHHISEWVAGDKSKRRAGEAYKWRMAAILLCHVKILMLLPETVCTYIAPSKFMPACLSSSPSHLCEITTATLSHWYNDCKMVATLNTHTRSLLVGVGLFVYIFCTLWRHPCEMASRKIRLPGFEDSCQNILYCFYLFRLTIHTKSNIIIT